MIRVYSANFTPQDFHLLEEVLREGLYNKCACNLSQDCKTCPNARVCRAVFKVINYCEKKAGA